MKIDNLGNLAERDAAEIERELAECKLLGQVMDWAERRPKSDLTPQIGAETIPQDEYTIDVIIPFRDIYLVFDTT